MSEDWTLMPDSEARIAQLREQCRRLVRRQAALSAGVAAVPVPGLDILSDLRLFSRLIDDVNGTFGLSAAQIERMRPELRLVVYEAAVSLGGMLIGKIVTREVVAVVLRRAGGKLLARQAGKLVPVAGQLASATIGFFAFRQIGYQHVDACTEVARHMLWQRG